MQSRWLDQQSGRSVLLIPARAVTDWPDEPAWPSAGFGLLVATDATLEVQPLAERAVEQGLAVMAAWGSGCSEIEDTFDDAIIAAGEDETADNVILTTSHADEPLDECLEFFLDTLSPASDRAEGCKTWIIFALGDLAAHIEVLLEARHAHRLPSAS